MTLCCGSSDSTDASGVCVLGLEGRLGGVVDGRVPCQCTAPSPRAAGAAVNRSPTSRPKVPFLNRAEQRDSHRRRRTRPPSDPPPPALTAPTCGPGPTRAKNVHLASSAPVNPPETSPLRTTRHGDPLFDAQGANGEEPRGRRTVHRISRRRRRSVRRATRRVWVRAAEQGT